MVVKEVSVYEEGMVLVAVVAKGVVSIVSTSVFCSSSEVSRRQSLMVS